MRGRANTYSVLLRMRLGQRGVVESEELTMSEIGQHHLRVCISR